MRYWPKTSGKTTRIFARERSAELYQAASGTGASLKAARAEHGLGVKLRQLAAVATQVSSDLMRLGGASGGEQRVLAGDLQAAALESQRIGESLG